MNGTTTEQRSLLVDRLRPDALGHRNVLVLHVAVPRGMVRLSIRALGSRQCAFAACHRRSVSLLLLVLESLGVVLLGVRRRRRRSYLLGLGGSGFDAWGALLGCSSDFLDGCAGRARGAADVLLLPRVQAILDGLCGALCRKNALACHLEAHCVGVSRMDSGYLPMPVLLMRWASLLQRALLNEMLHSSNTPWSSCRWGLAIARPSGFEVRGTYDGVELGIPFDGHGCGWRVWSCAESQSVTSRCWT